ncbi:hypothetical protein DKX38_009057 [Salix brachista]|uniref:Uncharacterized protein n=1 Tax=Salix brachista TaxID=2182728 RepID=A0A5N5MCD6_9ROSI|nr:hypothetical protein DKX38_009057 [Salix brachista]
MRLKLISASSVKGKPSPSAATDEALLQKMGDGEGKVRWSAARMGEAVLFMINSAIRYLLMLVVISSNEEVYLADVLELTIGQSLQNSAMDWTGSAPTGNSGYVLLGVLVMVAMEIGLDELGSW